MEKLGLFGGTFSPIHIGHMAAAYAFMRRVPLDRLLVIPAFVPPHKTLSDATSPTDRYNMCLAAFYGAKNIEVSDIELKRKGKSYTYDTVTALKKADNELYLLCGTDMILTFDEWYRFEDILKCVTLAYVRREDDANISRKINGACKKLSECYGARIISVDIGAEDAQMCGKGFDDGGINIGVSSTIIREKLKRGERAEQFLHPAVLEYIKKHGLYTE